jgi:hypothetical protein
LDTGTPEDGSEPRPTIKRKLDKLLTENGPQMVYGKNNTPNGDIGAKEELGLPKKLNTVSGKKVEHGLDAS